MLGFPEGRQPSLSPLPKDLVAHELVDGKVSGLVDKNATAKLVLGYVRRLTGRQNPDLLTVEEQVQLLEKLPAGTHLFRGGSVEDYGEHWTFVFSEALGHSFDHPKDKRCLQVMTTDNLYNALRKINCGNILGRGNKWYSFEVGLKDMKKTGAMPRIEYYSLPKGF